MIFLLCGCLLLKAFRFPSHTKLLTNPTQSGDMVSKIFTLNTKSLTRLFFNLRASVNGKDESIRSLKSEINKLKDEIANLKIELSTMTNQQERILIRQLAQQIVEIEKQIAQIEISSHIIRKS